MPATGAVWVCECVTASEYPARPADKQVNRLASQESVSLRVRHLDDLATRGTRGVQANCCRDHEVWGGQWRDLFACVCVPMCGRQRERARIWEQLLN